MAMATTDLSEAKRLFQQGSYAQCKHSLLSVYSGNSDNVRILQKLGDVCLELDQFEEAAKYYQKLLGLDKSALTTSITKSLFAFGQLLFDNNQLEEATKFLDKCLEIQDSGAAHFYLGLIRDSRSQTERAIYHFQMASEIQPNVVRYHFQLAKCLQSTQRYDEAMKSYEKALELSEHSDAVILNEYSQFQYQCMGNKHLALDFAQLAAAFDDKFSLKLKLLANETLNTKSSKTETKNDSNVDEGDKTQSGDCRVRDTATPMTKMNINWSSLKCILYDFDAAIQYLQLEEHVSSNVNNLQMMFIDDFLFIFGRNDRINRLRDHLDKLQSIQIRIGLYIPRNDVHYRDLVIAALKRACLYSYFEFIEDPYSIHNVAQRLQLKKDECLLVSSDDGGYQCPERFGLSLHDLECIEQNLGFDVKMHTTFQCQITPLFLSQRNLKLYKELRLEILRHNFYHSASADSLKVIGWIKQNTVESPFLNVWMEFAEKFMFITHCSHTHRPWSALAVTDVLLEIEPDDPSLRSQRPIYLNCLSRDNEAELAYRDCLRPPRPITALIAFAYYLFKEKRCEEAADLFSKALMENPVSLKANIGIGRILTRVRRQKEAGYYFRKALAIDPQYPMAHVRYGAWLFWHLDDLEGAMYHYKEANRLRPDSDQTVYFISRIYRELGNLEASKETLIQCLTLNSGNMEARQDYWAYFGDPDRLKFDEKTLVLRQKGGFIRKDKRCLFENNDNREFAIFWVHYSEFFLNADAAEFAKYYLDFKRKEMFYITKLFEMNGKVLSEVIGITNQKHVQLIMDCIDKYVIRPYENYKNWLLDVVGDRQLGDELMDLLFRQSAIYSFDSFARKIKFKGQLMSALGVDRRDHVHTIWDTFQKDRHGLV